jgi:hypothetical protein
VGLSNSLGGKKTILLSISTNPMKKGEKEEKVLKHMKNHLYN